MLRYMKLAGSFVSCRSLSMVIRSAPGKFYSGGPWGSVFFFENTCPKAHVQTFTLGGVSPKNKNTHIPSGQRGRAGVDVYVAVATGQLQKLKKMKAKGAS